MSTIENHERILAQAPGSAAPEFVDDARLMEDLAEQSHVSVPLQTVVSALLISAAVAFIGGLYVAVAMLGRVVQ